MNGENKKGTHCRNQYFKKNDTGLHIIFFHVYLQNYNICFTTKITGL